MELGFRESARIDNQLCLAFLGLDRVLLNAADELGRSNRVYSISHNAMADLRLAVNWGRAVWLCNVPSIRAARENVHSNSNFHWDGWLSG